MSLLSKRPRRYKRASARHEKNRSFEKDKKRFYQELSEAQLQDKEIEVLQVDEMADDIGHRNMTRVFIELDMSFPE